MIYTSMTNEELLRECYDSKDPLANEVAKRFEIKENIPKTSLDSIKKRLDSAMDDAEQAESLANDAARAIQDALHDIDKMQ